MFRRSAAACLLLVAACQHRTDSRVETSTPLAIEIDAVLQRASADGSGFAAVAVADGEVILRKGYGFADRERQIPFTPQTVAQIGSLSKQFTATAILMLVESGRLDLDDPLGAHITGITGEVKHATLRQLLVHASGLPEYCGPDFARRSREDFVATCLAAPLRFEPGAVSEYSNVGYSALAMVVENVSGEDLDDYLRSMLLRPNGLDDSGYLFDEGNDQDFAQGYLENEPQGVISDHISDMDGQWWNLKGNGGMQASVDDMYAWYEALNNSSALPEAVRTQLASPQTEWSDGVAIGFGWFFRDEGTGRVQRINHAGSDGVFYATYWHRPEDGVFLFLVGNSGETPSRAAAIEIFRILHPPD